MCLRANGADNVAPARAAISSTAAKRSNTARRTRLST
jgi:hypothetical protein